MSQERVFQKEEIFLSNLEELQKNQCRDAELRICELADYARNTAALVASLIDNGFSVCEAIGMISDGIRLRDNIKIPNGTIDRELISGFFQSISALDKISFAKLLLNRLYENNIRVSLIDFLPTDECDESFAYMRNTLSDEAYDVFTSELENPKVIYKDSFKSVASALSSGQVGYAILPLEERGGRRISGIEELICEHDLKISAITPVFGFDGNADVKYALVTNNFKLPIITSDDDLYIEFSVMKDCGCSLSSLLSATEAYGISVYRMNTDNSAECKELCSMISVGDLDKFSCFLMFLTLFCNGYIIRGVYKNLE